MSQPYVTHVTTSQGTETIQLLFGRRALIVNKAKTGFYPNLYRNFPTGTGTSTSLKRGGIIMK
jgi:hypothetical protein